MRLWQWLAVFLNFRRYLIYRFALVDLKLLRHYGRQLRWRQWRDGQGRWWRLMRENGTTRESWWADGLFRRRILARPELSICPFPRKQMWKGKISFISNFWDVKMMMAWKRVCSFFRCASISWFEVVTKWVSQWLIFFRIFSKSSDVMWCYFVRMDIPSGSAIDFFSLPSSCFVRLFCAFFQVD